MEGWEKTLEGLGEMVSAEEKIASTEEKMILAGAEIISAVEKGNRSFLANGEGY